MRRKNWLRKNRGIALACTFGVIAAATLPGASGCSKREDDLRNCDVPALFQSSCDGSSCHGSSNPAAGLDLVSPGVDQRLFHIPASSSCDERKLVVPGHPEDSVLHLKVSEKKPFCGESMPPERELSSSELACLEHYINKAGTSTDGQKCETCETLLCVDFDRDPLHCGGCGQACDEGLVCGGGSCVNPCTSEEALCGASCVTLDSNKDNCGSCGHRCGPGSTCSEGVCQCDSHPPTGQGGNGGANGMGSDFESDLLPIFQRSCSGSACHDDDAKGSALHLTAEQAYEHLVDVTSKDCPEKKYVVPGSPDQSYLVEKLMGGEICAGSRMPPVGESLSNDQLRGVVRWICDGASQD